MELENARARQLYGNSNIIAGGTLEQKERRRKIALVIDAKSVSFSLPIFGADGSDQNNFHER